MGLVGPDLPDIESRRVGILEGESLTLSMPAFWGAFLGGGGGFFVFFGGCVVKFTRLPDLTVAVESSDLSFGGGFLFAAFALLALLRCAARRPNFGEGFSLLRDIERLRVTGWGIRLRFGLLCWDTDTAKRKGYHLMDQKEKWIRMSRRMKGG